MTHITSFSRVVCLLLVCLLLFWSIATPAYAVEPVSMTLIGVSAVCVVSAILIGLGVRPFVETSLDGFNALVNDIVASLPTEFLVANTMVGLAAKMLLADGITYAPRNLVEWILDYLTTSSYAPGAPTVAVGFKPQEVAYLPYSSFYEVVHNFSLSDSSSFIETCENCYFIRLQCRDESDGSSFTTYGYVWANTEPVFEIGRNLDVGDEIIDQYVIIRAPAGTVYIYSPTCSVDGISGFYSIADGHDWEYVLPMSLVKSVRIISSCKRGSYESTVSDVVYDDYFSSSLDAAWANNGVAVPGSIAAPDVVAVPVSVPATASDAVTKSRADIISGTKTVAETVSITETDTETGTSTGTASLWDTLWGWLEKIWNAIKSLVSGITVPIVNAVTAVKTKVASIADVFTGTVAVAAPAEAIHFSALFTLFPFNIPYGIYKSITLWGSVASAPTITVPLPTFSGGSVSVYEYEINVSEIPGMDKLAAIIRAGELILFVLGLGLITRKVTKW